MINRRQQPLMQHCATQLLAAVAVQRPQQRVNGPAWPSQSSAVVSAALSLPRHVPVQLQEVLGIDAQLKT
jgi:hypothetical protein